MQNQNPLALSNAPPYYAMIRADDPHFALRHNLVMHPRQHGIKAAARHFQCGRNTVRKWVRRYRQDHLQGLLAHSRAPQLCPP
jgi:Helix-turn-helix domain